MKKIAKLALCGLVVSVLTVGTTYAGPGKDGGKQGKGERPTAADRFAKMDADGSGEVTLEEFTAAHEARIAKMKERRGDRERPEGARTPPAPAEVFERMDENGDGVLTQDEIKDRRRGGKGARKGPRADADE